jgi:hypothetical protein
MNGRPVFFLTLVGMMLIIATSITGLLFYQLGPLIEARYFPVITESHLTDSVLIDGKLAFRFQTTKARDCKFLDVSWFRRENGATASAVIVRTAPGALPTRPLGVNRSGWWQIQDEPQASSYLAVLSYDCRWPWTTTVQIGPMEVKP